MIFETPHGEMEVEKEKVHIVSYPNDIMDGMLMDFGEQYGFVSEWDDSRTHLIDLADEYGATIYDLSECEVDYSQPPHSWCIRGLARVIIESAEELCQEAVE